MLIEWLRTSRVLYYHLRPPFVPSELLALDEIEPKLLLAPDFAAWCSTAKVIDVHRLADVNPTIVANYENWFPSEQSLFVLKWLSQRTGTPIAYYSCETWGSGLEHEFAWIFGTGECVLIVNEEHTARPLTLYEITATSALQLDYSDSFQVLTKTLPTLGLSLRRFQSFRPHERDFDWNYHRVEPR